MFWTFFTKCLPCRRITRDRAGLISRHRRAPFFYEYNALDSIAGSSNTLEMATRRKKLLPARTLGLLLLASLFVFDCLTLSKGKHLWILFFVLIHIILAITYLTWLYIISIMIIYCRNINTTIIFLPWYTCVIEINTFLILKYARTNCHVITCVLRYFSFSLDIVIFLRLVLVEFTIRSHIIRVH